MCAGESGSRSRPSLETPSPAVPDSGSTARCCPKRETGNAAELVSFATQPMMGTVSAVASDASTITVQSASGSSVTLVVDSLSSLLTGVATGDAVSVSYSKVAGVLTLRTLQVTGQASGGGGGH